MQLEKLITVVERHYNSSDNFIDGSITCIWPTYPFTTMKGTRSRVSFYRFLQNNFHTNPINLHEDNGVYKGIRTTVLSEFNLWRKIISTGSDLVMECFTFLWHICGYYTGIV